VAGYEVVIAELRTAGDAAASAGEQAGSVDLAAGIAGVSGALPGSRSAHVAASLGGTWQERITQWSGEAKRHGQNLTSSAHLYSANEQAAQRDLAPSLFERLGLF
jgi:predicted alpha/beta hydrolase